MENYVTKDDLTASRVDFVIVLKKLLTIIPFTNLSAKSEWYGC